MTPATATGSSACFALMDTRSRRSTTLGQRSRRPGSTSPISYWPAWHFRYRYVRSDGRQVWLYDRGRMFRDSEGRPSYMTGACVDITERKHTEQALRQSEERFRQFASHS